MIEDIPPLKIAIFSDEVLYKPFRIINFHFKSYMKMAKM